MVKFMLSYQWTNCIDLTWLARLGFQNMMPNYRGFETHRFSGEDDARNEAKAIERLEVPVLTMQGPVDPVSPANSRLALIENWWSERKLAAV
jgi:pimeloyl-ACP methyl ester carboxylesterase